MTTSTADTASLSLAEALAEIQDLYDAFPVHLRQQLDEQGYIIVPHAIDAERTTRMRDRVAALIEEEGPGGFHENPAQRAKMGHGRIGDVINKGSAFDVAWTHPLVIGAAWHVLQGPFKMFGLNANAIAPGQAAQPIHADTRTPVPGGAIDKLQCIIPLVDFTADNGATCAVPGSHRYARTQYPPGMDPSAVHPEQIPLCAPAGSLLLYNGNMYHRAGENRSSCPRLALVMAYIRRELPQLCDQAAYLRVSTARRLRPLHRWLLDA